MLAGATPQVLANAAMTRSFDVKDEIEVNDNLDKKPDPTSEDFDHAVETYFKVLNGLLSGFKNVQTNDKSKLSDNTFSTKRVSISPCPSDNTSSFNDFSSATDDRFKDLLSRTKLSAQSHLDFLSDCLLLKNVENPKYGRKSGVAINFGSKEFKYQILFDFGTQEKTQLVLEGLGNAFNTFAPANAEENQALLVLYKNTQLTSVNNQVFITTRLPRAGLDSLLASDAK